MGTFLVFALWNEVMPLALTKVASVEPVSIYVLWVGASLGIDKDIFISLLNIVLLLGLFLFCRKYVISRDNISYPRLLSVRVVMV